MILPSTLRIYPIPNHTPQLLVGFPGLPSHGPNAVAPRSVPEVQQGKELSSLDTTARLRRSYILPGEGRFDQGGKKLGVVTHRDVSVVIDIIQVV